MSVARKPTIAEAASAQLPRGGARHWLRVLRLPLLLLGVCVVGAIAWQVGGLPGTPVWAGVLLVEVLLVLLDRRQDGRREGPQPADEARKAQPPAAEEARVEQPPVSEVPLSTPRDENMSAAPARRRSRRRPRTGGAGAPVAAEQRAPRPAPARSSPARSPAPATPPETGPPAPRRAAPPDVAQAWRAEILWRESDGTAQFVAAARDASGRTAAVAGSRAFPWPPPDAARVEDMQRAVEALRVVLLEAGWTAAPRGERWYSLRFAWEPAPRRAETPGRTQQWPADTADLVRCQIGWASGYRRSRFEAVVLRPGEGKPAPIGASEEFRWMFKGAPDRRAPEHVAAVKRLRAALQADGWEEVGPGRAWYARRFVWRRDADPPTSVSSSASAEA